MTTEEHKGAKHYDIIVVGSGGGAKISTPAAKLGFKVALLEHGYDVYGQHKTGLGGTCLNRGCIPSKMLIHPADVATEIKESHRFSVHSQLTGVNFSELVQRVAKEIDDESYSINPRLEADPNRDWYKTTGRFIAPKTLQVGDQVITGDYIFLAAGSRPYIPPIPGLEGTPYMTSTEALRCPVQPRKLIVIGGGYIACELAHFFGGLGTEVHILARSTLLRNEDSETALEFTRVFSSRYAVHTHARVESVAHKDGTFTVNYSDQSGHHTLQGDNLLVATGVLPNSDLLDLGKAGIATKPNGFVQVDECLRTTAPDVFALGDLAGNFLFRHCVNYEAEHLMEHFVYPLHSKQPLHIPPVDYHAMPHAVFSYPQVAGVGETEDELKERGASYIKGVNPYSSSAMGMALRSDHGFVKLLIERGSRKILGCHIVGHEASTLIHQVLSVMRMNGLLDDILNTIHIHPALSELVRNAARKARDALVDAGDDVPLKLRLK